MKKDRTAKLIKISGILLESIALTCIVICIVQDGSTQWLLSIALLCNALSFLLYFLLNRKKE